MKKIALSAAVCAMMFSVNAKDTEVVEESVSANFSTVYAGVGFGGNFAKNDVKPLDKNRFMGSFAIGAGKQFRNGAYVGGEFLGDFSKKVSAEDTAVDGTTIKASLGGFVPHLNFKAGYVIKNDILLYGKLGVSWRKIKVQVGDFNDSKRKAAFVLGAGIEKAFCKKFSAAFEVDYDFGYKWKKDYTYRSNAGTLENGTINANSIGKSWNIRALVKYNIKY